MIKTSNSLFLSYLMKKKYIKILKNAIMLLYYSIQNTKPRTTLLEYSVYSLDLIL